MPSTTATSARPWDSPAVVHRNTRPIFPRRALPAEIRASPTAAPDRESRNSIPVVDHGSDGPSFSIAHDAARRSPVSPRPVARHIDGPCGTVDPRPTDNRGAGPHRGQQRGGNRGQRPHSNPNAPVSAPTPAASLTSPAPIAAGAIRCTTSTSPQPDRTRQCRHPAPRHRGHRENRDRARHRQPIRQPPLSDVVHAQRRQPGQHRDGPGHPRPHVSEANRPEVLLSSLLSARAAR